mmetsp:Transcript_5884/g.15077  ORF Transcript_5884/g.15077 Transcript_5884/m.15077 type:complete len:214 (+) Transcript_5884:3-644(+)
MSQVLGGSTTYEAARREAPAAMSAAQGGAQPAGGGGAMSQACKDPRATMGVLSIGSGIVLFVGGLTGAISTLNVLRAMVSVYSMVFGLVIIASECKEVPIISVLYRQLEFYAHFIVYPRGKALFYLFIGFLTFFANVEWSLSKIASLIVMIVGALHFLTSFCIPSPAPSGPAAQRAEAPPDFHADATREAWQFARDHPETARQGASVMWKASR